MSSLTRRVCASLFALAATAAMSIVTAAPASAGWRDGDVINYLPSYFVVKIAKFGVDVRPGGCSTWNAGWFSCKDYWLPSGKSDDQVVYQDFDTDGFMVETHDYYVVRSGSKAFVRAGTWTKIPDFSNASCSLNSGRVECTF